MKRKMIYSILLVVALLLCWQGYEFWVAVGRQPRGERLERCKQSPQWRDGEFVNVHETPTLTGDEGLFGQMYKFLFGKVKDLSPDSNVPTSKSSLKDIPRSEDVCVWLGHSTVYLQTGGVRFLFDPVLTNRLPVWWFMRPFKGADVYTVNDIPEVDYLIITHDHWDHLDWKTVMALKDRAGQSASTLNTGATTHSGFTTSTGRTALPSTIPSPSAVCLPAISLAAWDSTRRSGLRTSLTARAASLSLVTVATMNDSRRLASNIQASTSPSWKTDSTMRGGAISTHFPANCQRSSANSVPAVC